MRLQVHLQPSNESIIMLRTRRAIALALSLFALPVLTAEPLDVGAPVPDVSLQTESGSEVALRALVDGSPTVLIFYRGGWCPYCNRHLAALVDIVPDLEQAGYQILAISPDRPEKLRAKPDLGDLPYTLLSDSPMTASSAFGIAFRVDDELVDKYLNSYGIDLEGDSGQTHHLLPHPSVYIVDGDAIIRYAHVDPKYKVRMDPDEILATALTVAE